MTKIDDFLEEIREDIYEDKKRIEKAIEENEVSQDNLILGYATLAGRLFEVEEAEKALRNLKRQLKNCLDKRIKKGK